MVRLSMSERLRGLLLLHVMLNAPTARVGKRRTVVKNCQHTWKLGCRVPDQGALGSCHGLILCSTLCALPNLHCHIIHAESAQAAVVLAAAHAATPTFGRALPCCLELNEDAALYPDSGLEYTANLGLLGLPQLNDVVWGQIQCDRLIIQQLGVVDCHRQVRKVWQQLPAAEEACKTGRQQKAAARDTSGRAHEACTQVAHQG